MGDLQDNPGLKVVLLYLLSYFNALRWARDGQFITRSDEPNRTSNYLNSVNILTLNDNNTIQAILEQRGRKRLTHHEIILLIIEYLYCEKEPRSEYNIRSNIFKGHSFRPKDFKMCMIGLCMKGVCRRIRICKGKFVYILTEFGEREASKPFNSQVKDFLHVLDLPTTYNFGGT